MWQHVRSVVPYFVIALAVWLLSQYLYLLPVHIAAFFAGITGVILSDLQAAWWVYKGSIHLPHRRLVRLHRLVSFALATSVVSGAIMAWPVRDYLLGEPSFQVKLVLVAALIINASFIGRHLDVASQYTFAALSTKQRLPLFVSGAVSSLAWIGTVIAALLIPL